MHWGRGRADCGQVDGPEYLSVWDMRAGGHTCVCVGGGGARHAGGRAAGRADWSADRRTSRRAGEWACGVTTGAKVDVRTGDRMIGRSLGRAEPAGGWTVERTTDGRTDGADRRRHVCTRVTMRVFLLKCGIKIVIINYKWTAG